MQKDICCERDLTLSCHSHNRFCGLKGHEMFCEVERSYIEDGFNLYGLRTCVSNFSDCLDLILDRIGPDDSDDSHLTQSACTLYGLIHARYIITAHGLDAMYNKVRQHFAEVNLSKTKTAHVEGLSGLFFLQSLLLLVSL
jgi:Casein kinase II regulatory subunit